MRSCFNLLSRHQLYAQVEDKKLTNSLKGLLISSGVPSHDIGLFLKSKMGDDSTQYKSLVDNVFDEVRHDPLLPAHCHTRQLIMDALEKPSVPANGVISLEGSESKKQIDKMLVHQQLVSPGTLLDRIKSAAVFLKNNSGYSLQSAKDMIMSEVNLIMEKGLTLRAVAPEQEDILAAIVDVYKKDDPKLVDRVHVTPMQRKQLDIQKFLMVDDLANDLTFSKIAPDLIKHPAFSGNILEVDPSKIDIFVPDPRRVADYLGGMDLNARNPLTKAHSAPDFDAPMLLTEEWATRSVMPQGGNFDPQEVIGNMVVINAGWFNIFPSGEGGQDTKERLNPHTSLASFPMGPAVSGGEVLASHTRGDKGQRLDAITFRDTGAVIHTAEEMQVDPSCYQPKNLEDKSHTINGFKILGADGYIHTPENNKPNLPVSRTGVGVKPDGKLVFVVATTDSREHGITARQFAQLFKEKGCISAINLDNSGSSSMTQIGKTDLYSSDKKSVTTYGSDVAKDAEGNILPNKRNRPIPLALVIKPK